jgi:hypothetical protein
LRFKIFIFLLFLATACEPQLTDDPIPLVAFNDVVINLGLPAYTKLRNDGSMMAYNGAGIRGIIIYRVNANVFKAYERNCSYHPNEASSTVDIDASNLFLKDYSCNSQFTKEDGMPGGGPAWRPLRQYHTDVNGGVLTITSDVIN